MLRRPTAPSLFDRQRQTRRRPESERVYQAVLTLRARGFRVYRAGSGDHHVNGARYNNQRLIALASARRANV